MIRYEIKKVFSKTGSKVGFLVLAATLLISCYFAITSVDYVDEKGDTHTGISAIRNLYEMKEQWEGPLTEEVLREVIRENDQINAEYPYHPEDVVTSNIAYSKKQGFSDIREMINQAFSEFREYNYWRADSVTEEEAGSLYENRVQSLKRWLSSEEAKEQYSEKKKAFFINQYETLETPFVYEYADAWEAALEYASSVIMLTVLVLSFFAAGIFSDEFHQKADSIFFSSRYGRDKGTASKIIAGVLIITGIYWGMILLYSLIVFGSLGINGWSCAIQASFAYWKSFYHINFLQAYLLTVFGGYVGTLFILALSMLVSAKTHTTVLSVTIPFVIIFIQSFLGGFHSLTEVLGILPDQLLQMNMVIKTFTIYELGGKVTGSVPIILVLYSVLAILLLPMMYHIYRRTELK